MDRARDGHVDSGRSMSPCPSPSIHSSCRICPQRELSGIWNVEEHECSYHTLHTCPAWSTMGSGFCCSELAHCTALYGCFYYDVVSN